MAIRVKLPNGQYGSFPDDMPHEQIESVLQKQFPQQPEQGFLNKLPRNIAAGLMSGAAGLANLPYEGAKLIGNPGAEYVPHFGEHDYGKMAGLIGEPTASDEAIQFASGLALPIGGAARTAYKGAKAISKSIPAFTSKGIAKEVSAGKDIAKGQYNKLYNKLFEEAERKGLTALEKPDINAKLIEKNSMPKYHTALKEFMEKPTVENAHRAQSDLGKMGRAMEKSDAINPLTSSQQRTYRAVQDAQSKIKESMFQGHPELSEKYSKITQGYKKDVVPYTTNKALTQFGKGELGHAKLVQRLKNNDAFMLAIGKQYPGIKINELLNSKSAKGILGALLAAGGWEGGKTLIQ